MLTDISIIIPTMNRPESLKRTLDYIVKCRVRPGEVIVVDQSLDSNIANANRETLSRISNIINAKYLYQENPSLTRARNYGIRNATKEIIVCSDDDVDVKTDIFEVIQSIMMDRSIAMIAGLDRNTILSSGNWGGVSVRYKIFHKAENRPCNNVDAW